MRKGNEMYIRYLKPTHNAQPGDTAEVPDAQANVLILLGIAEETDAETPPKPAKKPQKPQKRAENSEGE